MGLFLLRYFTESGHSPGAHRHIFDERLVDRRGTVCAQSSPSGSLLLLQVPPDALLLRQTRSLFDAVVAHATTNAALGLYVVLTIEW